MARVAEPILVPANEWVDLTGGPVDTVTFQVLSARSGASVLVRGAATKPGTVVTAGFMYPPGEGVLNEEAAGFGGTTLWGRSTLGTAVVIVATT